MNGSFFYLRIKNIDETDDDILFALNLETVKKENIDNRNISIDNSIFSYQIINFSQKNKERFLYQCLKEIEMRKLEFFELRKKYKMEFYYVIYTGGRYQGTINISKRISTLLNKLNIDLKITISTF